MADHSSRFWQKVERRNESECWLWTAGFFLCGYGRFWRSRSDPRGRTGLYAHRVAWELTNGPVPDGLCILHSCDNRACVNPSHLHPGTKTENNRERDERRRTAHNRGQAAGRSAKLRDQDIPLIRAALRNGRTQQHVAEECRVSRRSVGMIHTGRTWGHIQEAA